MSLPPHRASSFSALPAPSVSLPQRASTFAALPAPAVASSSSAAPLSAPPPRPPMSPRRHTMRPLRSSPLAGPSLGVPSDNGHARSSTDHDHARSSFDHDHDPAADGDVSSAACGSVYGYGSSSSEHHAAPGPNKLRKPEPVLFPPRDHDPQPGPPKDKDSTKAKRRASASIGKLFAHADASTRRAASASAASVSSAGTEAEPARPRASRRSSLLPPAHSSSTHARQERAASLFQADTQSLGGRRRQSTQGQGQGHWLTAVPPAPPPPLTHLVRTLADPASPEATWMQVVAAPRFSREGIRREGVVMPVRKAERPRSRSAMAVVGGSGGGGGRGAGGIEEVTRAHGEVFVPPRVGSPAERPPLPTSPSPSPPSAQAQARASPSPTPQTSAPQPQPQPPRPSQDETRPSLNISPSMARAESPLAALGRRMSVELARAQQQQGPTDNRRRGQGAQDDRRPGQNDDRRRGQSDDWRRGQSAQDARAPAPVLPPPARAFVPASLSVPAWRVSQLSHVSSVSSMQSYATALESPPPETPTTPEARTPETPETRTPETPETKAPEESLAPSPPLGTPEESLALPVLRVRSGTDGSADTPSLTRSRTVSSSGSGSVRTAGREKEREEEQAGADEKAGVGAGAGAVEVRVNGVPVEFVPLPRDTQGTARRRTTLRKKHAPLVAAQVTVAVSPAHDERAVKRGGTIKRVWRKMFKSAGAR